MTDRPPMPSAILSVALSAADAAAINEFVRAYGAACAAAEREACAVLAHEHGTWGGSRYAASFDALAAAIRARETP